MKNALKRRDFLASAGMGWAAWAQSAGRRPNFVIIFADDLGYGDLACYGSTTNRTPHLDRMAAQGVRFTDAYVPMPYCAPSRASLLTGRYPFRTGVTGNPAPDLGIHDVHLPHTEITIAEALKPLGYATMALGKWHLGHLPEFLPRKHGFDEYYGILYSNDMRPVQIVENESVAKYPVVQGHLTRHYTERALRFIGHNKDRPFLLYLPHAMPHKPLAASEEYYTPETPDDLYADVIRELDWSVGQILERLKQLNLDQNTVVIFTSDNGPWYGGSTAGLRGMKSSGWEGGFRVPLIARWPGRIPAGQVSSEICGTIDLFPTVCKLAGAALPSDRVIDGRDIYPLMTQRDAKSPHEAIFMMAGPALQSVRSGRWKLHVPAPRSGPAYMDIKESRKWVDPRGPDGITIIAQTEQPRPHDYPGVRTGDPAAEMMLFDLENDRGEQHNVAAKHPDIVRRLKALYDKMNAEVPKTSPSVSRHPERRLTGGELRYDIEPKPLQ